MAAYGVIGASHHTAPVAVRERLAVPGEALERLLVRLARRGLFEEALVLDTCNRTECYYVAPAGVEPHAAFLDALAETKGTPVDADPDVFYQYEETEAARHLFRVAASLDSQIVGEDQILGQVKAAYRVAVRARATGLLLNKLLHRAFRAGKRVRTETDLGRGSASVAQAAVELAGQIFTSLAGRTVLLVGAGRNAELAARALLRAGAARLLVANRTLYRAQQLAADLAAGKVPDEKTDPHAQPEDGSDEAPLACETEAVGLEDVPEALARADLVLASTGAPEAVLTEAEAAPALRRRTRPLVILDVAVPRDVEEGLGRGENVFLYNMDDLDRLVARNLEARRREVPRAEAVVEDEVGRWTRWLAAREVAPTIRRLTERVEGLRTDELAQHGGEFGATDRAQLDRFTRHLVGRVLHGPLAALREVAENGSTGARLAMVEALRKMFDLADVDEEE